MIDWSKLKTAEQQAQERWQAECDAAAAARANAYRLESDPLKTEAEFDAIKAGVEPNYSAWVAKVEEIKARFPLPSPLAE
ncbi:hypothetical protein [Pseudomonas aeruginosa]|uniref:hypothetical protein n=2 Tax=Pseudomonas aeruginosa TaxID=287 RepID=UPI00053E194D|nr:hypothetical protein [Pseudomonas aeruginosa]QBI77319.1 hypothetical protein [Pseudomonas phage vB_Pae_CF53a]QBI77402.1 hypothetical protein [Pseudomonas phage vB_Pae_CF54a]QBI77703.1 hypothetical protein [Pseudomonas phage vB_Pae_CF121c]QBI77763.1 hypothetical protein [Pseudomonas phage vB_Pae_CF127a]QBI78016.1 hypothetical protein [Pseudomonas phage vB_Pae_CF183a]QBI78138.1 hypothetical protein [Pseudomonas phage vB_Pae_BR52a]QBI78198.1 hypothetical protein [Pseudomonas phage vB_Pae_BR1